MIIENGSTLLDGMNLGSNGTAFVPFDDHASYAFYERNGRRCGVLFRVSSDHAYLRFSPNWQMPEGARNKKAWDKFAFEADGDGLISLDVDFRDGEVHYSDSDFDEDDLASIEAAIERNVEWLTATYNEALPFVRQQLVHED